ncbi:hypothetical protein IJ670_00865, partial [bacterium]|nr:hypothetical protein [bacterium]
KSNKCSTCGSINGCSTCSSTATSCNACSSGYYKGSSLACFTCSSITNCTTCNNTNTSCTGCATHHAVSNGQCSLVTCSANQWRSGTTCHNCSSITGCSTCTSGTVCTECTSGYYLASGMCTTCASISGCTACSPAGASCTGCQVGSLIVRNECKSRLTMHWFQGLSRGCELSCSNCTYKGYMYIRFLDGVWADDGWVCLCNRHGVSLAGTRTRGVSSGYWVFCAVK